MPWSGGVYTRGYPSWSNDAANNLPISATKFDTEDNDFATGLNNCLTKDGLTVPTATLTWAAAGAVPVANFTRGSDGTIFEISRTAGTNNPQLQLQTQDATGVTLNSTFGTISLAIAAAVIATFGAAAITLAQPITSNVTITPASAGTSLTLNPNAGVGLQVNGSTSGTAINVTGANLQYCLILTAGATVNQSLGLQINAGTSSTDAALAVRNQTAGSTFLELFGDGHGLLGVSATLGMSWDTAAHFTWSAPNAGGQSGFTFNGRNGNNAMLITQQAGAGTAFGLVIQAGTNSSDYALAVNDQTATTAFFRVLGTGECFIQQPTVANNGPTGTWQVGYLDEPQNNQTLNFSFAMTDRGKQVYISGTNGAGVATIPANGTVAFPKGSIIRIINQSTSSWQIQITTDTLLWLPTGAGGAGGAGTRNLAINGACTIEKVTTTQWVISGVGLT